MVSPGFRSPGERSFHSRGPAAEKLLSSLLRVGAKNHVFDGRARGGDMVNTRESSAQRDLLLSLVEQVVHLVAFDNLQ